MKASSLSSRLLTLCRDLTRSISIDTPPRGKSPDDTRTVRSIALTAQSMVQAERFSSRVLLNLFHNHIMVVRGEKIRLSSNTSIQFVDSSDGENELARLIHWSCYPVITSVFTIRRVASFWTNRKRERKRERERGGRGRKAIIGKE